MRYFVLGFLLIVIMVVGLAGFRGSVSRKPPIEIFPDMDRQPKFRRGQRPSTFFPDGHASRLPVEGTVARGSVYLETPFTTGRMTDSTNFVQTIPVEVTADMVMRGREQFQIYCAPCHSPVGDGNGVTKSFGMAVVANLHDPRIVGLPDGEIFHVITYGRNLMGPYGSQVATADRWAIVAYVRALQLARLGLPEDLPEADRAAFAR